MNGNILLETTVGIYPFITRSEFQDISKYITKLIKLEQTWSFSNIINQIYNVSDNIITLLNTDLITNTNNTVTITKSNNNITVFIDTFSSSYTASTEGTCILTVTAPETVTHNALLIIYDINIIGGFSGS